MDQGSLVRFYRRSFHSLVSLFIPGIELNFAVGRSTYVNIGTLSVDTGIGTVCMQYGGQQKVGKCLFTLALRPGREFSAKPGNHPFGELKFPFSDIREETKSIINGRVALISKQEEERLYSSSVVDVIYKPFRESGMDALSGF